MSSTSDPIKHEAQEPATEEPSAKKAKINDQNEQKNELDANNATTASNNEKTKLENNNGSNSGGGGGSSGGTSSSDGNKLKTPSKTAVNGNKDNKESKPGATGDEELYNEEDDDDEDDEDEGGNLDGVFDPKIAKSLELVEEIQSEITNLNEKASEEILKVEQKFNKLRRPHFEKRNEVLKDIPNFWLTSLANHPIIAPMIESAEDEDCLHYMVDLDVEEYEDIKSGYKLKLHFVNNPYIKNEVIVKEFQIVSSEEVLSSSTPIEYKDTPKGQSLKNVVDTSIAQFKRGRRPGQRQQQQSFFAWLTEPSETGTDEIAEILKDQIWPSPLEFFFASPDEEDYANSDESDEDEETDYENMDGEEGAIITEEMVDFSDEELEGEDDDGDDDDDEDEEEDVE